ncbi:MAG: hypothetical protein PHG05_01600 [Candidatus Nanoarchaeia archaeon]|nr:hypothetical protein [Candidatus Nanoarchaeia archaeon]
MSLKETLRPNHQKLLLFLIFTVFSVIAVFFGEWDLITNSTACRFFGINCAPPNFLGLLGAVLGAAPAILIVSYLLAALFVHEEHARKHKTTKRVAKKKTKTRGKHKKR